MAFPFTFESNFERGTNGDWDSQTDLDGILDFPHYTELARFGMTPYSGAHSMRAVMNGGSNPAFVTEDDVDIAAAARGQIRFWCYPSSDLANSTSDDTIRILKLENTPGGSRRAIVILRVQLNPFRLNFGCAGATGTTHSPLNVRPDFWYLVELDTFVATDLDDEDGTMDLFITREDQAVTLETAQVSLTSLDFNTAVGSVDLGVQTINATTFGTILFDNFVFDDGARSRQEIQRWSGTQRLTQSGHVFVGPGKIDNISFITGSAAVQHLRLWDTDQAFVGGFGSPRLEMHSDEVTDKEIVDPAGMPIQLSRGAYIELVGDDVAAQVEVSYAVAWGSNGNVARYGLART